MHLVAMRHGVAMCLPAVLLMCWECNGVARHTWTMGAERMWSVPRTYGGRGCMFVPHWPHGTGGGDVTERQGRALGQGPPGAHHALEAAGRKGQGCEATRHSARMAQRRATLLWPWGRARAGAAAAVSPCATARAAWPLPLRAQAAAAGRWSSSSHSSCCARGRQEAAGAGAEAGPGDRDWSGLGAAVRGLPRQAHGQRAVPLRGLQMRDAPRGAAPRLGAWPPGPGAAVTQAPSRPHPHIQPSAQGPCQGARTCAPTTHSKPLPSRIYIRTLRSSRALSPAVPYPAPGSFARPFSNSCGILGLYFSGLEALYVYQLEQYGVPDSVSTLLAGGWGWGAGGRGLGARAATAGRGRESLWSSWGAQAECGGVRWKAGCMGWAREMGVSCRP